LAAVLIGAIMIYIGIIVNPDFSFLLDLKKDLVLLVSMLCYILIHEIVHGIFIWHYSGKKPKIGFTGLFAFAGNKDSYFDKKSYVIIGLSPIVILGLILLLLNIFLPHNWFWVIYVIQTCNISGAVGDLYITYKLSKMPEDTLANDEGIKITFYSKNH
jgi:hypothetical protein